MLQDVDARTDYPKIRYTEKIAEVSPRAPIAIERVYRVWVVTLSRVRGCTQPAAPPSGRRGVGSQRRPLELTVRWKIVWHGERVEPGHARYSEVSGRDPVSDRKRTREDALFPRTGRCARHPSPTTPSRTQALASSS